MSLLNAFGRWVAPVLEPEDEVQEVLPRVARSLVDWSHASPRVQRHHPVLLSCDIIEQLLGPIGCRLWVVAKAIEICNLTIVIFNPALEPENEVTRGSGKLGWVASALFRVRRDLRVR